jgi:hypothetical protein
MLQILVLKGIKGQKNKYLTRFNETAPKTGKRMLRLRRLLSLWWDTVLKSVKVRQTDRTVKPKSSYKKSYCLLCFMLRHKTVILRHQKKSFPLIYIYTRKICTLYTGRFIIFSVITDIYNKKTKGPTLIELFTAKGKLKKFFLTTRDVRCVHHGWHGTHRTSLVVEKNFFQFSCGCEQFQFLWFSCYKCL